MCSEISTLKVSSLSKRYQIYDQPHDRLKQSVVPRLDRLVGRTPRSYFREFWALRDVTFDVKRGESVAVIGRNGAGKSTLLQLLCGTLQPSEGTIERVGRVSALLELGAGFNPEFTGRENVYLNATILGLSRSEIESRLDDIFAFADIGQFIDQPVKIYSSGMYVRLAFAVAINVSPDLLLVDEALSVGDSPFQAKCLLRVRRMLDDGVSMLLVTHSMNTAIEFCQRALYLRKGTMRGFAEAREMARQYAEDVVSEEQVKGVEQEFNPPAVKNSNGSMPDASTNWVEDSATSTGAGRSLVRRVRLLNEKGQETGAYAYGDKLVAELLVHYQSDVRCPCLGIQVLSVDDITLWSNTTMRMERSIEAAKNGETRIYRWRLPVHFGGGRYHIALGVGDIDEGEYRRHHRLYFAAAFEVYQEPCAGRGWLALPTACSFDRVLGEFEA